LVQGKVGERTHSNNAFVQTFSHKNHYQSCGVVTEQIAHIKDDDAI